MRSKLILAGTLIALAGGGWIWLHLNLQAKADRIRQTEAAWNHLQQAETSRLAAELQSGLETARQHAAEMAIEASRLLTLTVESLAAGATVRLFTIGAPDTVLTEGSVPFSHELPKGRYRLVLTLDGYETYERELVLTRSDLRIEVGLRPLSATPLEITRPAKAIAQSQPVYPPSLRKAGVSGSAVIEVLVNSEGRADEVTLIQSTHPDFGSAALTAMQQWRFEPALHRNQAVPDILQVPFSFSLEPPPPSTTTPDTFANSLGMKFARLPGTRVHLSVWLTREQDYEAFVRATSRRWQNAATGSTHPAVNVSWSDARSFCAWLTERERKDGKITAQQTYRLPTDAEWSLAAGLNSESGASPKSKDSRITNVFPWGKQWPPPPGVGNYGPSLGIDNFAGTSPVDAFSPNALGYHDMGGNVWQWCEDEYDSEASRAKVLRGASYSRYARGYLLTSFRHQDQPETRDQFTGFRCVLESHQ